MRRDFVAGKIIIGRKRIEDSGVRTVQELLKREPAVTVGADGRLGLLHMPGYTQVLIDGHAPPAGQEPGTLELIQVEKIEIVKSSVAEFGPFGIAGTINIVTRTTVRKTSTDLSAGLSVVDGRVSSSASLSHNESNSGSALRWTSNLSANRKVKSDDSRVRQSLRVNGAADLEQSQARIDGDTSNDMVHAGGSLTWQRYADNTVTVSADVLANRGTDSKHELRRWVNGDSLDARQEGKDTLYMLFLPARWQFKPTKNSRAELGLNTNLQHFFTEQERNETLSTLPSTLRQAQQRRGGRVHTLDFSYKTSLEGQHDVKLGGAYTYNNRDTDYDVRTDGIPDFSLAALGTRRHAVLNKESAFIQDDWRVTDSLALSAGVSGVVNTLTVREGPYTGQSRYRLWSPSFHVSKKIDNDDKRQFRLSLARSYKAPENDVYTLRPEIHPLAPCAAGDLCGPNTVDTADTAGNLHLRPEKAVGLNLEYEHGIGADSQITVEFYSRHIGGKFGTDITLETVPWAQVQRYVARPANLGNARSNGVDLAFELSLSDLSARAPKAILRGSIGLARSRVDNVPGPDNRLDKQTPWSAKLGGSYSVAGFPLKFDLDASWSPGTLVRTSMSQRLTVQRRSDFDASAKWSINKDQRLILGVRAAFPRDAQARTEYFTGDQQVRIDSSWKRFVAFDLRFESKL